MAITFNESTKTFAIMMPTASYFMRVDEERVLRNLYFGARIETPEDTELEVDICSTSYSRPYPYREEYICRGRTSFDEPCILPEFSDGVRDARLKYICHNIDGNKLTITLVDEHYPLKAELLYEEFEGLNLIRKSVKITNESGENVKLTKMKSATLYTPWGEDMRVTYMHGRWGSEYIKEVHELNYGRFTIDSRRGTCSGPQFVPFFALDNGTATETMGDVFYGALEWSGNFKIDFETPYSKQLTVTAGVNDFDCEIDLKNGESFSAPGLIIGYSGTGFEGMSNTLYDYQFDHICSTSELKRTFPVIYNSWYPYAMDVNEENCISCIKKAKDMGAELFVIDDGWFGGRVDEHTGLGDWYCNMEKFPNGLGVVSDAAHDEGMLFGLWLEPEMVSERSQLYKDHPEWVLKYETRSKTKFRHQCILNLAREDVMEFVWQTADRIISEYKLDYLKWDMNSYISEAGNATYEGNQKTIFVKYIENLYTIWDRIRTKYPDMFLECSAHGGARSDYGMLRYSDRMNRSDNSDPVDVLKLHEGFTMYLMPRFAGGASNLAISPNDINGRVTPLKYRAALGMTSSMSVGLNILKMSDEEFEEVKEYIRQYKTIRHITQNAYMYRISSAFESNCTVWEFLGRDKKEAVVFAFGHGMNFREVPKRMKLRGLDENKRYKVSGIEHYYCDETRDVREDYVVGGDALMKFGLLLEPRGDYDSIIVKIQEVEG